MFAAMAVAVNNPEHGFCRDCMALQSSDALRCERCGSPRLARHPELYRLHLAHIDCDAFYAAVEKRDNPALKDKPLIIGGGKRGVVSTACYIARIKGVRSAMPMFKALEACPEAVVIPPDMEKYVRVGREVRAMMQALTPLVEPLSIDEAFLDLSGTERLHGRPPAMVLADFAKNVEKEIGITVSAGLSYCKFLAKVASDFRKPRGFSVIGEAEALGFLAEQPVTLIWGVGKAFAATLERDGIRMIGQLQKLERADLMRRYGSMGDRLYHLSRGQDERMVACRPRRQERVGRNDLRHRSRLARRPGAGAARAVGESLGKAEEVGHRRPYRGAEAQDAGFQAAHPQPPARRSDPACRPHLPDRAASAGERNRRHEVPAARHRRQRPDRC